MPEDSHLEPPHVEPPQIKVEISEQEKKPSPWSSFLNEHKALLLQLLHLCAWNQLGVILRVQLSALFGGACMPGDNPPWQPCVTSPGLKRLGGAMFLDVPENVLGSFAIGLFSTSTLLAKAHETFKPIKSVNMACLPPGSPLQHNSALHLGLRTGFCGSLTTFASWILQMVKMMIGGSVSAVGTEWVAALWGIYVNVALSLMSLVIGQHLAIFLSNFYQKREKRLSEAIGSKDQHKKDPAANMNKGGPRQNWLVDLFMLAVLLTLTGVSLAYAITDGESSESPYSPRSMWFSILLGPTGCIARWVLALHMNAGLFESQWFYWGTWTANISACIIDFTCASLLVRVPLTSLQSSLLNSIITGISGSLSTVSTWVVELQTLGLKSGSGEGYIYGLSSIVTAISLGIIIYGSAVLTM